MDGIMARWKRLGTTLTDNAQKLQELMAKLLQFEVRFTTGIAICCLEVKLTKVRYLSSQYSFLSRQQNDVKTLKKWMADVDVFLNEEWPALGDSEALEKQLEQCTVRKSFRPYFKVLFQQFPFPVISCVKPEVQAGQA